jgi:hypothetical protein
MDCTVISLLLTYLYLPTGMFLTAINSFFFILEGGVCVFFFIFVVWFLEICDKFIPYYLEQKCIFLIPGNMYNMVVQFIENVLILLKKKKILLYIYKLNIEKY